MLASPSLNPGVDDKKRLTKLIGLGVTVVNVAGGETPIAFCATSVKSYDVPFVRPVIV